MILRSNMMWENLYTFRSSNMAMGNPPLTCLNGKNTYRNGGFSVARFDCQMETHNTDELCQVVAVKKGGTKLFPWVNGYCSHDTMISHIYILYYVYFRRNKVYASWKLDKASISVNRGSHFQVRFVWKVWEVWDGQLSPSFQSIGF
jgi:hypothetical protein